MVLDDSTYTITYHRRGPGSPLDDWMVYLPKHLLEGLDPETFASWEFWMRPVGNGPYRFVRRVPKTAMVFEANPDYYRGRPRIDRVVVKFAAEASLTELLSGNVDALVNVNPGSLLQLGGDVRFRAYSHYAGWGVFTAVYWNHRHPAFRDPRVRRALTLAIDRQALRGVLNLLPAAPGFDAPLSFPLELTGPRTQIGRGNFPLNLTKQAGLDQQGGEDEASFVSHDFVVPGGLTRYGPRAGQRRPETLQSP